MQYHRDVVHCCQRSLIAGLKLLIKFKLKELIHVRNESLLALGGKDEGLCESARVKALLTSSRYALC